VVEHDLAKVGVEGSNPFARSNFQLRTGTYKGSQRRGFPVFEHLFDALTQDQLQSAGRLGFFRGAGVRNDARS
jgi:hypothetical protein